MTAPELCTWPSCKRTGRGQFCRAPVYTRSATPDASALAEALRAIIERWDTPAWKDAGPTGAMIERARKALAKWEGR
jgi:hypothetical protein